MLATLRAAFRGFRQDPGFALAFVLTLGLGIGATTAIFSAVEGVLIRQLPYPHADRIVYARQPLQKTGQANTLFSFAEVADYRAQARTIEEVVEYGDWTFNVVGLGDPRVAFGGLVTSNYFKVLAIRPHLGRTLTPEDDSRGSAPVAVLTYEFWQRVVGSNPNVVNKTIELSGVATTVVGVLEPGSHYAGTERAELYANYPTNSHYMSATMQGERQHRMTDVYALLKAGVPLDAARADMKLIADRLHAEHPADYPESQGFGIEITPWRDVLVQNARPTLLILMGAVGLVLLVACANVGNLTLARLVKRERELSVRAALGATPLQLRMQLMAEHLVLALAGAALGLGIAALARRGLADYASRMTLRADAVGLNGVVLAFSLAISVGAAFFFAWMPKLPAAGGAAASSSAGVTGGRATAGRGQRHAQRALVVAQVAVSFVVLVGAGLLVRTFMNLQHVDPGFDDTNVLALRAPNFTRFPPDKNRALFDEVTAKMQAYPGVQKVAVTNRAPYSVVSVNTYYLRTQQGRFDAPAPPLQMLPTTVSPSYFSTLDIPILRGRQFGAEDTTSAPRAVVINETLARTAFGADDPLNRQIQWSFDGVAWQPARTVVGVAKDVRDLGGGRPTLPVVYESSVQAAPGPALLIKVRGDSAAVAREAARVIHELDPKRAVTDVELLSASAAERVAPSRLNATLFGGFAILALAIAAVGVGGVLAFSVSERTREFGIRMALGSGQSRILTGVLREGLLLAGFGLLLGVGGAFALSRFLEGLLFEVRPLDALTFGTTGIVLILVALGASWLPAHRATTVDPTVALRAN